jgi:carboxyl-terminal processing protease
MEKFPLVDKLRLDKSGVCSTGASACFILAMIVSELWQNRPGNQGPALGACLCLLACWLGASGCSAPAQDKEMRLMAEAWNTIQQEYVRKESLPRREVAYGAISGMVDALGDTGHSAFLSPEMVRDLRRLQTGEFRGIGVEIRYKEGQVMVVAPMDGSPAQKAGLQPGDIIKKIYNDDVTDWPLSKVVERIAGPAGTSVKLTIHNPKSGRTRQVTVQRANIKVRNISWVRIPGTGFAHLRLANFDRFVAKELRNALVSIQEQGIQGAVLDLRNNPGGILEEAITVASQFLSTGNVLLMKERSGSPVPVPVEKGGAAVNMPLVVLINGGSASAAEIVAGALQDGKRATLVGEKTFGTGTVLREFPLSDGSAILLAIEEWLTPAGRSFWHKGLAPDISVTLPDNATPLLPSMERGMTAEELMRSDDRQLLRALEVVKTATENPELNPVTGIVPSPAEPRPAERSQQAGHPTAGGPGKPSD